VFVAGLLHKIATEFTEDTEKKRGMSERFSVSKLCALGDLGGFIPFS
jgi:hypothetical protein